MAYIERKGRRNPSLREKAPEPVKVRKDERGRQIGTAGIYDEAVTRFDSSDFIRVKKKGTKDEYHYRSRRSRLVKRLPAKGGHSWNMYRSVNPPAKKEYRQLVLTIAWRKKNLTAVRKGFSSKRRIRGMGEEKAMYQEAFFSSKTQLGFSPDSYTILNHYYLTWKYR